MTDSSSSGFSIPQVQWVHVEPSGIKTPAPKDSHYVHNYPVLFNNDFWLLREHMNPVNATVKTLPLQIDLTSMTFFKFQLFSAITDSFDKSASGQATGPAGLGGGVGSGEIDMVKRMLLETNPWYLGLTILVSLLHSWVPISFEVHYLSCFEPDFSFFSPCARVFEFLAFSSDIGDWKKKQNVSEAKSPLTYLDAKTERLFLFLPSQLAGISVGSIFTNIFVKVIILLYLLDSSEETSWMIIAGEVVGVAIECWKITKALKVSLQPLAPGQAPSSGWRGWFATITGSNLLIEDKHVLSEEEKETQEYDKLAFKLVSYAAGPLLICWTIYSAIYQTHKGWWSFVIGTLCSFVYAFGFVSMIPQLIVNYKLKSTAGINAKTMAFKLLSTGEFDDVWSKGRKPTLTLSPPSTSPFLVVDDFFAFVIPIPFLHRLACFR